MTTLPVVAAFGDKYRVVDDPLQWVLQARHGSRTRPGPDGPVTVEQWRDVAFCRTRKGIMDSVREKHREHEPDAMRALLALPERHPNRTPADGAQ